MELQQFDNPMGDALVLGRYPLQKGDLLRPWDAADEYVLQYLEGKGIPHTLIVNDRFGALSCALAPWQPVSQSDSYIARWSTEENLLNNGIAPDSISYMTSLDEHKKQYARVIIRVPNSLAALEDTLLRLRPYLSAESQVLGCAMAKQIHKSTLQLFERIIGPTQTSLAKKKARLIFTQLDDSLPPIDYRFPTNYTLEGTDFKIYNHANVFCRDKLDIGTRFFIQHLPTTEGDTQIVDLGCGNGIVGLMAASKNRDARIQFIDESVMAVESARLTFEGSGLNNPVTFSVGDALSHCAEQSQDMVLCNPPFHQQTVVGDAIAWRMFKTSRRALRVGGELWVIGNRHLKYQQKLKVLFGNVEQVAANPKFVILKGKKR